MDTNVSEEQIAAIFRAETLLQHVQVLLLRQLGSVDITRIVQEIYVSISKTKSNEAHKVFIAVNDLLLVRSYRN